MGLVDVESAATQPANRDGPATTAWASTGAAKAGTSAGGAAATLQSVAKFLDALLQFIFTAAAEVLCASLRATDAD